MVKSKVSKIRLSIILLLFTTTFFSLMCVTNNKIKVKAITLTSLTKDYLAVDTTNIFTSTTSEGVSFGVFTGSDDILEVTFTNDQYYGGIFYLDFYTGSTLVNDPNRNSSRYVGSVSSSVSPRQYLKIFVDLRKVDLNPSTNYALIFRYKTTGNWRFFAIGTYFSSFSFSYKNFYITYLNTNLEQGKILKSSAVVETLPIPIKSGFLFLGWYHDATFQDIVTLPFTLTSDVNLYAKFVLANKVNHNLNGGNLPLGVEYPSGYALGSIIDTLQEPTKQGYTFDGWYYNATLTQPVSFPLLIENDFDLYAGWIPNVHKLTFHTNNATNEVIEVNKNYDEIYNITPSLSAWENHIFLGWYKDIECTTEAVFPLIVQSDLVFYAKWKEEYTLTYMSEGKIIKTEKYNPNSDFDVYFPEQEALSLGKGFSGWYTDEAFNTRYVYAPISSSFTLYARWSIDYRNFKVVVIPNKTEYNYLVAYNSLMYTLPIPSLLGWQFKGWYTDGGEWQNEYDFNIAVVNNVTIYAYWVEDWVYVSVDLMQGKNPKSIEVQRGQNLELDIPIQDGYVFEGWYTDVNYENKFNLNTAIMSNIALYAKWTEIEVKKDNTLTEDLKKTTETVKNLGTKIKDHFQNYWQRYLIGTAVSIGVLACGSALIAFLNDKNKFKRGK